MSATAKPQPFADFHQALGFFQSGNFKAALAPLIRHLETDSGHADGWHLRGVIHLQMGEFDLAVQALRRATELSGHATYFSNLSLALKGLGDREGALAASRRALELAPEMPEAHNNLGNLLLSMEHVDDAIAAYREALRLRPDYIDAIENLARTLRMNGRHKEAVEGFRAAVQARPRSVKAQFELANALRADGDVDGAIVGYGTVIALAPDHAEAHNNLGAMLGVKQRVKDATASFEAAVALRPSYVEAWLNLAAAYRVRNDADGAEQVFRRALTANPGNGVLMHALGTFFRDQGRIADAIEVLQSGAEVAKGRDKAEQLNSLGLIFKAEGRLAEAKAVYQAAIDAQPDFAEGMNNLGIMLKEEGDLKGAESWYRAAMDAQPQLVDSYNNLGVVMKTQGRLEEAVTFYTKAITIRADYPEGYSNLGSALSALGRPAEALVHLRKALAIRPKFPEAFNNMGVTYMEQGRTDEAFASFAAALELRPIYVEANSNLAVLLVAQGRLDEAYEYYDRALSHKPDFVDANWNRSLAYLLQGRFDIGWDAYRWRWKRPGAMRTHYPGPEWDGSQSLAGKTLVMVHEQGLGDNLQFVRYVQTVRDMGGRAVIHVPREIRSLVATIGDERVVSEPEDVGAYHFHIPMLCLARVLKTDLTSIPGGVPYLHPTTEAKAKWADILAEMAGFKVGIVWRGRPEHKNDRVRSMTALQFCRILADAGVSVVNLQRDVRAEELALMRRLLPRFLDVSSHLDDFMDTAAAISNLDLVISVDTSVAHAAGAIGAPVWTLIPYSPDWRWLLGRDDSPWYPTMRLFRQPRPGDWDSVIDTAAAGLAEVVAGKKSAKKGRSRKLKV